MRSFYPLAVTFIIVILLGWDLAGVAQTTTFTFNGTAGLGSSGIGGSPQTYVVPSGVTSISVDMYGGSGGWPCCSWTSLASPGTVALGGRVQCTMAVTPGSILYIYVGGAGADNLNIGTQSPGGWNGGGTGGAVGSSFCAGGGGESDIRTSTTGPYASSVLVVAGGGGGGGDFGPVGGAGGDTIGGAGQLESCLCITGGTCGGGQSGPSCSTGSALGTQGQGGQSFSYSDGGGGGGWWGGNCGNSDDAGGGGSSYPASPNGIVTAITHTQGYAGASGNGQVTITAACSNSISGTLALPVGTTTTLTDASSGGAWTSGTAGVATIGSSTGVLAAISVGTSIITYTGGGCTPTDTVTIVPGAATVWYSGTGGGDASSLGNWWSNSTGNGYQPTTFANADTWVFQSNMTSTAVLTFAGNVTIAPGGTFTPLASSSTTIGGNWNNTGGSFVHNSGTVVFSGANSLDTLSGNMTGSNAFNHLSFNASSASTYTISNSILIMGNFNNITSNGTISLGNNTLTIDGNWNSVGPVTTGLAHIIMNGNGSHTMIENM